MWSVTRAERVRRSAVLSGEVGDHPDTTTDEKSSGNVCALRRVRETARGHFSLVIGGVL